MMTERMMGNNYFYRAFSYLISGANIGIYTVLGASIVGPSGRVIALEPSNVSFRRLERNVLLNQFAQVILVNAAVCETLGSACLYHADAGPVSFSLVAKPEATFEMVRTTTIDTLVESSRLDHVDCIKLDVEGVEAAALRGARSVLARFKPTLIFERTSAGQRRQPIPEDLPSIVRSLGYRIYRHFYSSPSAVPYKSPNLVGIHPEARKQVPAFLSPWPKDDQ